MYNWFEFVKAPILNFFVLTRKSRAKQDKTKYFVKSLVQIQRHRKKDFIASTNLTKYCQKIVKTLFEHGIVRGIKQENLVKSLS